MNNNLFIEEMQNAISKLKSIDELYSERLDLTDELKQFETKSHESEFSNFDFEQLIDNVLFCEDAPQLEAEVILDLSVLYCATMLINNGLVTYADCKAMEGFTFSHLERIAKIVDNQITFELPKFIVNDEYLRNCLCCPI